ncbi:hypothetical protein [Methanocella conradii]|uniref:hypothetical protein n=1 Tax=Methanocella conradii TaxID=1175444 RepID=UPI00157DA838|nr:hypothetical protein [Methanocella conradii]
MSLLGDAFVIIKKDWKLLATLNALYLCVIIIGATIAMITPGLQSSMIEFTGSETISGPSGAPIPASLDEAVVATASYFLRSFVVNTLALITIPSIILPFWAPIIGAARFFIWGVTYVSPLEGVLSMGKLMPEYVAMLLEGEAYIIAIFASVRQLVIALESASISMKWALKRYTETVAETLRLLAITAILLAIASLYQAIVMPVLTAP